MLFLLANSRDVAELCQVRIGHLGDLDSILVYVVINEDCMKSLGKNVSQLQDACHR